MSELRPHQVHEAADFNAQQRIKGTKAAWEKKKKQKRHQKQQLERSKLLSGARSAQEGAQGEVR